MSWLNVVCFVFSYYRFRVNLDGKGYFLICFNLVLVHLLKAIVTVVTFILIKRVPAWTQIDISVSPFFLFYFNISQ